MVRKISRLDITNVSPIKLQGNISVYYNYYKDKFYFKLTEYEEKPKDKIVIHLFDIDYKKIKFITKKDFMDIVNEKIDVYNRIRWYNLIEKRIRR